MQILTVDGKPSGLQLPSSIELAVAETEPGVKGDTVSNVTKPAKLETGATVQVPLFVNTGDRIKVDPTRRPLHLASLGVQRRFRAAGFSRGPSESRRPLGSTAVGALPSRVPASSTRRSLLSQEPLAGRMPTADLLRLAELLDGAGFAYLEVSGGGVFDTAVRRGVESPWERIRALKARTKTPLGMALRGRFLVGSRPVGGDFARRFVASAAESGIDVFRLEDPLNDV